MKFAKIGDLQKLHPMKICMHKVQYINITYVCTGVHTYAEGHTIQTPMYEEFARSVSPTYLVELLQKVAN